MIIKDTNTHEQHFHLSVGCCLFCCIMEGGGGRKRDLQAQETNIVIERKGRKRARSRAQHCVTSERNGNLWSVAGCPFACKIELK